MSSLWTKARGLPLLRALGKRSIGFAFSYAWVITVYLCCSPHEAGDVFGGAFSGFYIVSFLVAVVALILAALFGSKLDGVPHQRMLCVAYAICSAVGTILLAVGWERNSLGPVVFALSALLTGAGQALFYVLWGEEFARHPNGGFMVEEVCIAFFLASLLSAVEKTVPQPVGLTLVAAFPVVSTAMLWRALGERAGVNENDGGRVAARKEEWKPLLMRICAGLLLIGIAMGVLRCLTGSLGFDNLFTVSKVLAAVVCCVAAVAQNGSRGFAFSRVYRAVMLFMALGVAMLPFVSGIAPVMISRIGVTSLEAFVWVVGLGFVACFGLAPHRVLGFAWASLTGGLAIGALVGNIGGDWSTSVAGVSGMAVILLSVLLAVTLFVLSERELIALEGWGLFAVGGLDSEGAGGGYGASDDGFSNSESDATDVREIYRRRARCIATEWHLSSREEEILVLLALGCSRAQIKDELCLSMGTVNTHISHLYDKLGVRGKNDVVALLRA